MKKFKPATLLQKTSSQVFFKDFDCQFLKISLWLLLKMKGERVSAGLKPIIYLL